VEELNIKAKNWKDLLTDEPFQRKDIITLQDPMNHDKFNLNNFHHLKFNLKIDDDGKLKLC
jgi:peptidyl-prolyl cis-trans isomerase-like protein 2